MMLPSLFRSKPWRCVVLASVLAVGCGLAAVAHAQPGEGDTSVPVEEYWRRLEQTRALVDRLESEAPSYQHEQLLMEARRWQEVESVVLPHGEEIPIDTSFLVAELGVEPVQVERLRGLLAALLAARSQWPESRHQATDVDSLATVLSRPEFQWQKQQPSPLARWWAGLRAKIDDFLARLLTDGAVIDGGAALVRFGMTIAGVIALLAVLVFTLRGLAADLVADAHLDAGSGQPGEQVTSETAYQRAQALSRGGDYRTAVRYLYLSTLLLLDERGLLRYDRTKTNREYLRSVSGAPKLESELGEVIDVFDRTWYGHQVLSENAYAAYEQKVGELRAER